MHDVYFRTPLLLAFKSISDLSIIVSGLIKQTNIIFFTKHLIPERKPKHTHKHTIKTDTSSGGRMKHVRRFPVRIANTIYTTFIYICISHHHTIPLFYHYILLRLACFLLNSQIPTHQKYLDHEFIVTIKENFIQLIAIIRVGRSSTSKKVYCLVR